MQTCIKVSEDYLKLIFFWMIYTYLFFKDNLNVVLLYLYNCTI